MCSSINCLRFDALLPYSSAAAKLINGDRFEQVPLERYFPEYTGGSDINKAAKYILWKFMQANRARLSVYPQYVRLLSSIHLVR